MKRACAIIFILLLGLSAQIAGTEGAPGFSLDWRCGVELSETPVSLSFVPEVNSLYDIFIFPDGECSVSGARLEYRGETVEIGSGARVALTARLTAGREYTLTLRGAGKCTVEVMRRAAGRSFSMSAELEDGAGSGLIARAGNVGWFRFAATGERYAVRAVPAGGEGLSMVCEAYLPDGSRVAVSERLDDGSCVMYVDCKAGQVLRVRASSPEGGTGAYVLKVDEISAGGARMEMLLAPGEFTLTTGQMRSVRVSEPLAGECPYICFESSNPSVASVTDGGLVAAVGAGEAIITAHGYGGISASAKVSVISATPWDMGYFGGAFSLRVGETSAPELTVYPSAAADSGIVFESSDTSVAAVDETGAVTGVSEGTAEITASWGDISAKCEIIVKSAGEKRRALLVGVQEYDEGVNVSRVGSVNTVMNLAALLGTADFDGAGYETRVELDVTREELLSAISEFFEGARAGDVSLFYITCHGYFKDGVSTIQLRDGSELTAPDLERALRGIPGTIIVLVDCCASGGAVSEAVQFSLNMNAAFVGETGALRGSRYKVLASADVAQDSYRLGYSEDEGGAATVFGRALCDALGWDMAAQRVSALGADANYDGQITLWEAYLYVSKRVKWYLTLADADSGAYIQTPEVYPEGDQFVLYQR